MSCCMCGQRTQKVSTGRQEWSFHLEQQYQQCLPPLSRTDRMQPALQDKQVQTPMTIISVHVLYVLVLRSIITCLRFCHPACWKKKKRNLNTILNRMWYCLYCNPVSHSMKDIIHGKTHSAKGLIWTSADVVKLETIPWWIPWMRSKIPEFHCYNFTDN